VSEHRGAGKAPHSQEVLMRRSRTWLVAAAAAVAIGCSGDSTGTSSDNGGNNGGGGPVGAIIVGNDFFQSSHNGIAPAVDTVPAGQVVTWTWTNTGATLHSILSDGPAMFTGLTTPESGNGNTFTATLTTPGIYNYHCGVHGPSMHGTIVVQ
jgi:plastocyanin